MMSGNLNFVLFLVYYVHHVHLLRLHVLDDESFLLIKGIIDILFAFRPYEVIAVATYKGITIWHLGLKPDPDGRLSTEKVALLSGHEGEVLPTTI